MEIEICQLSKQDWELYRFLRLKSLQNSPCSFGSSYEAEVNYTKEKWHSFLSSSSDNNKISLPLVAFSGKLPVGLALGYVHNFDSKIGFIYQMWINPDWRNKGIGHRLIQSIILWAKELKLNSLKLSVTKAESLAINFYLSCGFKPIAKEGRSNLDFILDI